MHVYIYCVQQNINNYGLYIFLNIENFIRRHDKFTKDLAKRNLISNTRTWHDREEETELIFIIVNLLHEINRVTNPQIK